MLNEYDTINPKNLPKVLNEGNLDYADPPASTNPVTEVPKAVLPTAVPVTEVPVPLKPKEKHLIQLYYQQNKEAIMADIKRLGAEVARVRWAMSETSFIKYNRLWSTPSVPYNIQIPAANNIPNNIPTVTKLVENITNNITKKVQSEAKISVNPVFEPIINQVLEKLEAMNKWLESIDLMVSDIQVQGIMEEEMKIDIITAFLTSSLSAGAGNRELAKKILYVVEAIDRV